MRWMNRQEISVVEGEQQRIFIEFQQVLIRSDEQSDFRQDVWARIFPSFCSVSGMSAKSIKRAANRMAIAIWVEDNVKG